MTEVTYLGQVDGTSSYEVQKKEGTLHVAGYGERVADALASFIPGK